MHTLRLGILGSGQIVRDAYAPILAAMPGVELVAIAGGRDRERAAGIARKFSIAEVHAGPGALLARDDLDAVVIALPNALHAELATRALERGLHVLCEKPLAIDFAGAQAAVAAATRHRRLLAVDLPLRVLPATVLLHGLCATDRFGTLRSLRLRLYRRSGIPGHGSWFTRRRDAGAGALFDLGSHLCDLAVWLAGPPAAGSVACRLWSDHGPRGRGRGPWGRVECSASGAGEFDVDDRALVRWTTAAGVDVEIDAAWAIAGTDELRFELRGSDGGADLAPALHGIDRPLRVDSGDESRPATYPEGLRLDADATYAAWTTVVTRFIEAVRNGGDGGASGSEFLVTQRVLDEALAAAATDPFRAAGAAAPINSHC